MSYYYIIPKINNGINITFDTIETVDEYNTYISHSLVHYLTENKKNLQQTIEIEDNITFEQLSEIVNPYEYIFTAIPNYNLSISKLKPESNTFFEFFELSQIINLFESFQHKNIQYGCFEENSSYIVECMKILREDKNDTIFIQNDKMNVNDKESYFSLDFIYYEIKEKNNSNKNKYIIEFMNILNYICHFQKEKGLCVIKLSEIYYKPIIDILFMLSHLYEKCYIIKPNTSNVISNDKYLICKFFHSKIKPDFTHKIRENILKMIQINNNGNNIQSLIKNEISYFFLTKLEEFNMIIGQQQLDSFE